MNRAAIHIRISTSYGGTEIKDMIRSMTGFGRAQRIIDEKEITVEIRSVNHRYHEFSARIPNHYRYLEDKLKGLVSGKVNRCKVEVCVLIHNLSGKDVNVTVNRGVVESYLTALNEVRDSMRLDGDIVLSDVFRMSDAFTVVKSEVDEDELWNAVREVACEALEKFVAMRENEGSQMKADIVERLVSIESALTQIEKLSPEALEKHRAKLLEKMQEIVSSGVDEQRVLLEAAIFAEKTAIDEETVRLRSHIAQTRELLQKESIVGRKLDFIVQEMNREVNTIGSKSHEIAITRLVVDLKSELEKFREQIQNIE